MLKAVLFDLYETLVTERERILAPMPANAARLDMDGKTFGAELRKRREKRFTGGYPDYASVLADICVSVGLPVDAELLARIEEQKRAQYAQILSNVDADVLGMLNELREMGLKTAVVSNAAPEEMAAWEQSPLRKVTDVASFSCEAGAMKPDARIYRTVCDRLGVAASDCVFVGDGGSDELPGAAAVGMKPYCATWFMDLYPEQMRRDHSLRWNTDYPKLCTPRELTERLQTHLNE